jgi:hypothetical protein
VFNLTRFAREKHHHFALRSYLLCRLRRRIDGAQQALGAIDR